MYFRVSRVLLVPVLRISVSRVHIVFVLFIRFVRCLTALSRLLLLHSFSGILRRFAVAGNSLLILSGLRGPVCLEILSRQRHTGL